MHSQDWFEYVRANVVELAKLKADLEEAQTKTQPKGQQLGSIGHGSGGKDASSAILKAMEVRTKHDRLNAKVERMLEHATAILYGEDGRSGLAKERCSADADCILGYYLLAMTWREVSDEMVRPESVDGPQWCKRRAYRAFEWLDERNKWLMVF